MTTQKALPWQAVLLYFSPRVSRGKSNHERSKRGKISKPWEQNVCLVTFLRKQITDLPGHPSPVRMISITPPSLLGAHEGEEAKDNQPTPTAETFTGCSHVWLLCRHPERVPKALGAPTMWPSMSSFLGRAIAAPLTCSRYGQGQ